MERFVQRGKVEFTPMGNYSLIMTQLLKNRGMNTEEKAEAFLNPGWSDLHDPFQLRDMEKAVRILRDAREKGYRVQVYGDYDVDGVCATVILTEVFEAMGITSDFRIPSRHAEGYGLNEKAVEEIARDHQVLVTVDCGITSVREVRKAKDLGMQVIVTDHHHLPEELPGADAVINPLLGDYPFRFLCGAGVALKLGQALLGTDSPVIFKCLDVAALATVADVVTLTGENRVLVKEGLKRMEEGGRPGLKALMELAAVKSPLTSTQVAFRLAPRINAGGRLEDADQCVRLLLSENREEILPLAAHLDENNRNRQNLQADMMRRAEKELQRCTDMYADVCLVVMGQGWNPGVIGLVAGKLCENYHMPAVVLSDQGDTAVGSCRSVPGVDIHAMLKQCEDLLVRFGGHEQAAGLTVETSRVDSFRKRLNEVIRENCDLHALIPEYEYDRSLVLGEVTADLVREVQALEPTGQGNPPAEFLVRDAWVQSMRPVGQGGAHLKMTLSQGSQIRDGIAFSRGELAREPFSKVDVLMVPERNEFRDRVTIQMQVSQIRRMRSDAFLPADRVFEGLLQELCALSSNTQGFSPETEKISWARAEALTAPGRGCLLITHDARRGREAMKRMELDMETGRVRDMRPFNTLLVCPDLSELRDVWREILLLDGDLIPGEVSEIRKRCPRAAVTCMDDSEDLRGLLGSLALRDEQLRALFIQLRKGVRGVTNLSGAAHLTEEQVKTGMKVLEEVELLRLQTGWDYLLLPKLKVNLTDSALLVFLRSM